MNDVEATVSDPTLFLRARAARIGVLFVPGASVRAQRPVNVRMRSRVQTMMSSPGNLMSGHHTHF